ncbi:beta-mannosidase [Lutibacter agarilyticus]|uniref:Beta-mannosidase B n=1 Tax=Lutibacter agarilyticus TaxID=1109740 RepID=A0A238VAD1_9FLAO|nr:sugar-binding domain-containing protein [Lutibacter agarilyticus]SNR31196.1 beta-mannosidase [Lutibacter agarilyticus]
MKYKILICALILFSSMKLFAQPSTISNHNNNSQSITNLDGYKWKMKMMLPGQGIKEGLHKLPPGDIETLVWNPAKVPGDVYTDLWKVGAIEDPYFGRNSVKAQWVMQYEWWYSVQFKVNQDLSDKVARLDFESIDHECDIWLNGHFIGSHKGSFSSFSFDVNEAILTNKHWLKATNMLVIRLAPPPQVNANVAGLKTPWFGDYWRDLIPFGITGSVDLVFTGKSRILDVYAKPVVKNDKNASVIFEIEVDNTEKIAKEKNITISFQGKNFTSKEQTISFKEVIKPGKQIIKKEVKVENPQLWWPWDLGKPNLYEAKVSLDEGKINQDFKKLTYGLRKVEMAWNPGFTKDEVSFPRTTLINGKPIFIRSACWGGPPDIFVGRTSEEKYRKLIALAKEANMNNIRIFGWHPPEIPLFYQLCNEQGITVWQDIIPLGTGNIPNEPELLERIYQEGENVIKNRRNNPSIIMMEGGEEMLLRASDAEYANNFLKTLGDRYQGMVDLPYVPDSPLTCDVSKEAGYKPKEAVHALGYFYQMGRWLMEDWYKSLDFPIVPELAITSVPNVENLQKFIPENEIWPPGPSWGHHWADLDRLRIQNFDAFGDEKTGSLQEFVDATQDAQGIIFQLSIEHFRRNKPKTSGIALCHFITYWPDMKWGMIDNYLKPKRSFNYVKTAYQPVLVNFNFEKRRWLNSEKFKGEFWVVNDYYKEYKNCNVSYSIVDDNKNVLKEATFKVAKIEENSAKQYFELEADVLKKVQNNFYVTMELTDENGTILSSNEYMFLIGNQKEASEKFKVMGEKIRERNGIYSYGNYYKFFDILTGENGEEYESEKDIIKPRGFE